MTKKYIRVLISVLIAVLFLWLALKDLSFYEVRITMKRLTYSWLLPYVFIALLSHYIRAERWKQLIENESGTASRWNLFSGVMLGYLVNYAVPRLGEVSRSIFVGNQERISRSHLMGTVVVERALDLLVMFLLILFVVIYLIRDYTAIIPIFGTDTIRWIKALWSPDGIKMMGLILLTSLGALFLLYWTLSYISRWLPSVSYLLSVLTDSSKKFAQGLISIKDVKNWPLFILYTAAIWFCYVLLTYIPFTAFNMHSEYGLGFQEALVITVISALGVSIPSPGGIGTYHWFVSQSLLLLFAVPEALGVSYAIVTHLVMMIVILVTTPILLAINKAKRHRSDAQA